MDYNRIVQEILNIGEELLKSGAEIFRVEDSLYRMCRSYGFVRSDVYASQINIQMTVETPEGEIITQIRYIEMTSPHYDKLDQLNNLSRYVCANTPKQAEIHERYEKIAKSKVLAFPLMVLAQIVSGTSFAIFFGGGRNDAIVAVFASAAMALTGYWIGKQEKNPMIYNLVLAFVTEMVILLAEKMGIAIHSDRIMIGIVMVLISTLGVINGLRDVVQRNFTSGALEIMNSVLGALGIAFGIALAMKMLHGGGNAGGAVLNSNIFVQAVSVSVGSIGLAGIYQIRGKKVIYSGIGAFLTWTVYLIVRQFGGSYLFGMLLAAVFVGMYAFVMARINKAPSTIFLTASVFPLMPGANLYYMMYGCVKQNLALAIEHMILLVETCLMIVFGFLLVDIVSRIVMRIWGQEYHIGKNQ